MDISDEEFEKIELPHVELCSTYAEEYLIPDYVAFYIATGYYQNALWENSIMQHFNSAADMFNVTLQNKNNAIENVKKILKLKYSLEVVEEYPILKLKKRG